MKTLKEKSYEVNIAVPETKEEEKEIKKIIQQSKKNDKEFNPNDWIKISKKSK